MFLRRAMPSGLRNIKIKISYVWSRAGQGGSLSVTGYKPKYDARQLKFDGASARAGKDKRPFGANFFCKRGTVMSEKLSPTRRALLATSAAAGVASAFSGYSTPAASSDAIRPFRVDVPEKQLVDLRRRISMTRWPDRETVADQSQGPQLATLQELARYWVTEYDWRKCRGAAKRGAEFRDRDRWAGHPLHPRSFEAQKGASAHHKPRLAGFGHRAAEDHWPTH